ncbi:N-acetylmuramoyl-L-alanine amidase [Propionibacteriaceae bacterium Y1700]|uniref:N-acetylmuramoyl-L-alanine amidase n=1 Tax=Microlunatus sp. Y1700 TaxID=3418487 RepID=UPI003DA76BA9
MTALSRRHFLIAGAATATAAGLTTLPTSARAEVRVDESEAFARASAAHDVPVAVLAAFSYAQTRWQDHQGSPSTSLGYGPMHLIDGAAAVAARGARADKAAAPVAIDTLALAAERTGRSRADLKNDPVANIDGGAAVLAALQSELGHPLGADTDPTEWYAAAAQASGIGVGAIRLGFADHVMTVVRDGAQVKLADGSKLNFKGRSIGKVAQRRSVAAETTTAKKSAADDTPVEAPKGLDVEWIPSPYEFLGPTDNDYGNHDLANRPESPKITHIVIHDTECPYDVALDLVQDPTYVSWQYTLRFSDGQIAQHLNLKDVGWHAGNWYINSHSIGLEHEGYAAQTTWTTEALYRSSAALVKHLCKKYRIPVDRNHIIGHDQVPGTTTASIPGMHWDPGPFWDWEHYFELLGAPLHRGTVRRATRVGDVIRILPGFHGNTQPLSNCDGAGDTCEKQNTNFVTLYVEPSTSAALVNDLGLHQKGQPASTEISDISARATAGTEYVVAELKGDWTAIWYLGVKAWFQNPTKSPTARPVVNHPGVAVATADKAAVYGRALPEAEAYENPDDVQQLTPLLYELPAGQVYPITDAAPQTDYYRAKTYSEDTPGDHIDIVGKDRYYQINFGHRIAYVRAEEVQRRRR